MWRAFCRVLRKPCRLVNRVQLGKAQQLYMLRITMTNSEDMVTRQIAYHGIYSAPQCLFTRSGFARDLRSLDGLRFARVSLAHLLVVASCVGEWRDR